MKDLLIILIEIYQKSISRAILPSCRYYPSCSQYTIDALEKYGIWKGLFISVKRVLRCHPFSAGGYDPVK